MNEILDSFSLDEIKDINSTIYRLYDEELSLKNCMDVFMDELGGQIYFDKGDFTFYSYNPDTNLYEIQSFFPANWKGSEVDDYINTYIRMDDVLPILSKPQEIAFRNSDIFSADRKKTKYYREFVRSAQLEISIDANIPLSADCNIFAIFALYRNAGRKEFSLKDLEIVKMYQKHLSRVFEKHLSQKKPNDNEEGFLAIDNFESLGICILDSNLEFISYNTSFKSFVSDYTVPIQDSKIGSQVKRIAEQLSCKSTKSKLGPISEEIDGITFLFEISRYYQNSTKYICIVYPLSSFFLNRITSLKDTHQLTNREFEILYLMLKNGMTNEEIASHLFISPSTVKRHISNAYQKLGINNQKQLLSMLKVI